MTKYDLSSIDRVAIERRARRLRAEYLAGFFSRKSR